MSSELPQSRIKKIVKLDPDYSGISASAVHLITRATEIFIQDITSKASIETRRQQRKKIVYEDFYSVVKNHQSLYFLSDVVPKKFKLRELVENKSVQLREDEEAFEVEKESTLQPNNTEIKRQGILAFTNNTKVDPSPVPATQAIQQPELVVVADREGTVEEETNPAKSVDVMEISDGDDNDDDDEMIDS